jgi:signal transduction histidine kinase
VENGVEIVIADHGPGIPPDKHDAIFERFERIGAARSHGNLGVGLFIVKQLVEAHGGRAYVQTTDGGGATFVIELPLTPTAHETQREQDP